MKNTLTEWANSWGREFGIHGITVGESQAGQHDDLDAFRHAFCHAYLMSWGSFTDKSKDVSDYIGMIMEMEELFGKSATPCASQMDLHNNLVGQKKAMRFEEMISLIRAGENPTFHIAKRIAEAVKIGETINTFDDQRMLTNCHAQAKLKGHAYIWRTQGDDQVRFEHAMRAGKTFDINQPPPGGHPGSVYNCRCWAEPIDDK